MKPIILTIALLLQGLLYAQTTVERNLDLRGRSCAGGLGICNSASTSENAVPAEFSADDKDNLVMRVNVTKLSTENKTQLLNKNNIFVQDADFTLDKELSDRLGIASPIIIAKGNYKVTTQDNWAIVLFPLQNAKAYSRSTK
ncbi:MAG: hypothetical protein JST62_13995 [Bacteroidetes bacterium]|nr:hypothetical protein [Bacteroidota bacterium]